MGIPQGQTRFISNVKLTGNAQDIVVVGRVAGERVEIPFYVKAFVIVPICCVVSELVVISINREAFIVVAGSQLIAHGHRNKFVSYFVFAVLPVKRCRPNDVGPGCIFASVS